MEAANERLHEVGTIMDFGQWVCRITNRFGAVTDSNDSIRVPLYFQATMMVPLTNDPLPPGIRWF